MTLGTCRKGQMAPTPTAAALPAVRPTPLTTTHLANYLGAVLMQDAGGASDADEPDVDEDELPDVQSHAPGLLGRLQAMQGRPIYDFFMMVRRLTFTRACTCSCVRAYRSSWLALTCCGLRRTPLRWR